MRRIATAALTVLVLAGWCIYQLGKQENQYIRCGKSNPARRDPSGRQKKVTGAFEKS